MDKEQIVICNSLSYAVRDTSPVTPLHMLIIPGRHVGDYFELEPSERRALDDLLQEIRCEILARDPSVAGFNIGGNIGVVAGQTISHCHVHLIPRRPGDVVNPRGGVRAVIPGRPITETAGAIRHRKA
jgi:diadenosine tetraphosphate (Ap4A) HIT family hydrolase